MLDKYPKRIRKLIREFIPFCYEAELRKALTPLSEAFEQWKNGNLSSFDISEMIHEFHQGAAREIWKRYNNNPFVDISIAWAIVDGIVKSDQFPPELIETLKDAFDFCEQQKKDAAEQVAQPDQSSGSR
jgi:hypothetical protein